MCKRAEEAAMKAYPRKEALNKKGTGRYDPNFSRRKAYLQGYEQAERDTLEEEPDKSLEEEIRRYLREECSSDDEPTTSETARHFAEWGAEHLAGVRKMIDKSMEEAKGIFQNGKDHRKPSAEQKAEWSEEDDCLLLERAAITLRGLDFPELAGRLDEMRRRYNINTTL